MPHGHIYPQEDGIVDFLRKTRDIFGLCGPSTLYEIDLGF